ncbi:MAG: MAPEG family protein [Pseudomonadales bacterium]|nr:MAPEG family protein [Pseudomonadales bacterium]MCP5358374.1 MAPEG family protein [Pseudomonadales bacterium]
MEFVAIVVVLALLQYFSFALLVGKARAQYQVHAPAITGHPVFERYYRVHQNTLEMIVMFIPAIVLFSYWVRPDIAAGIGVVYLIGRFIYLRAYVADPASRGLGFGLSMLPILVLLLGGGGAAVFSLL